MKSRSFVLTAVLLSAGLITKAQSLGKTTFGIRAGVNFQNINGKDFDDDKLENDLKTGFHIGVNAEVPIAQDFYVQPGVLFSTKGAKIDDGDNTKVNFSYIEIPINLLYKPVLGTGRLLLGFGPYVAYAVGGKVKSDGGDIDFKFDSKVTVAEYIATPYAKRFDAGANFLFGYELSSKISAQLNAQLGLININPDVEGNDKLKWKNTGFGVSVGYRF